MAVLAPPDWQYPPRDPTMDIPSSNSSRQRSSPANDSSSSNPSSIQQQQQSSQQPQQPQQQSYPYPVQQQQPQGGWTPSIAAQPFYPSFYQNHLQQPQQPQPYPLHAQPQIPQQPAYFDPANAQLAQWAYQQMMFNAQQGFPHPSPQQHHSPQQQQRNNVSGPPSSQDYFQQNQITSAFNSFPSGTPPPHSNNASGNFSGGHRPLPTGSDTQGAQYTGFHPYRRPSRQPAHSQDGSDWRSGGTPTPPQPPYSRTDASGSTSSVNSSSSQRQRTDSNQSTHSAQHVPHSSSGGSGPSSNSVRSRTGSPAVVASNGRSSSNSSSPVSTSSSSRVPPPHHRNLSSSSSGSTAGRPSVSSSITTTSTSTLSSTSSSSPTTSNSPALSHTIRPARPSPLSQGNFTASEKRMSRDDSDLMLDPTPSANMLRSGGLKGRLRRALSFNAAQALKEEETDDDESIKASALASSSSSAGKLKAKPTTSASSIAGPEGAGDDAASTATVQTKKKGRAASLFNSRLNASTDNISLSSTVSSASVMIRKLGAMGKIARRNSLAGITSLFKDKKDKEDSEGKDKDKKGKKKDKKEKSSKGEASEASVSHVTAELDRTSSGDWNAGAEMSGLSPAAKLARQHTLKSNAEAAARAKAQQEAAAAAKANGNGGGVPAWEKNTTTRQGSVSPVKGTAGVRVNEDGTRVLVEDDDDLSDDGHYVQNQSFHAEGWDDDDDWGGEAEEDEDVTIRVGLQRVSVDEEAERYGGDDAEAWAVDVRRSVEKNRKPAKGILKHAGTYDQQSYLADQTNVNRVRSNSYNSHPQTELGPLARIPSPDPDHIDGLHRHPSHSSAHSPVVPAPSIPPLPFESSLSPLGAGFVLDSPTKELTNAQAHANSHNINPLAPHPPEKASPSSIFQHPNLNSSAPALSTVGSTGPPTLTHRAATTPSKRLAFASNLSVYDTFSASAYDRRSEPATWSRLTPALAQRIKEELNSYKMEEMEVHAASRIHTQFFV